MNIGGLKPDGTTATTDEDGTIHAHCSLPTASTTTLAGVKVDGTSITINGNGVISSTGGGGSYTLPVATHLTLGGVKTGGNKGNVDGQFCLQVDSDGTAYIPFSDGEYAGLVRPLSYGGIKIDDIGWISLKPPLK